MFRRWYATISTSLGGNSARGTLTVTVSYWPAVHAMP
jgi:hypothetical protein